MVLDCQKNAINDIEKFKESRKHSILISGCSGSGKTYCANYYASMLRIYDCVYVLPTVTSIKESITQCYEIDSDVVVVIENLDQGVLAAQYALLKFLEEPRSNVYVVVTCINVAKILDTIISRCVCTTVASPGYQDLLDYAEDHYQHTLEYERIVDENICSLCKGFSDVDIICNLSEEQFKYVTSTMQLLDSKYSVSSIAWKLQHFEDSSETPIQMMMRFVLNNIDSRYMIERALECLNELSSSRISKNACVSKFVLEYKYGG